MAVMLGDQNPLGGAVPGFFSEGGADFWVRQ